MISAIPQGYHSVTPYLSCQDATQAIAFYERALGAEVLYRLPMPDGKVAHAELKIGDSRIMLADENPSWGNRSPKTLGGSPVTLLVYTEDVDALAARFVAAGGKVIMPLKDEFYGDRTGSFDDPEGFRWMLGQHIEDVTPEEMTRRMSEMFASSKGPGAG